MVPAWPLCLITPSCTAFPTSASCAARRTRELVERAHALGYRALALTDECSFAGAVRAHQAAKEHGLPLILGSEITFEDCKLVLLATDRRSWRDLVA